MRTKLLLGVSFVLAVLVFASSAAGASGTPKEAAAAPAPRHVFTLFHQTWCVGDVSAVTPCDVTIGESTLHRTATHAAFEAGPAPIDWLRRAVRSGSGSLGLSPLDKALRLEELLRQAPPAQH